MKKISQSQPDQLKLFSEEQLSIDFWLLRHTTCVAMMNSNFCFLKILLFNFEKTEIQLVPS